MRAIDWVLLATCGLLLVAGPAMALQEWARHEQQSGLYEITGELPPLDSAFRAPWRSGLLVAVLVAGVAGTVVAVRATRAARVRSVSGRLLALLLGGMTLLDLAFLADGRWFVNAPYALRGATVVWLYSAAGILMGGSVIRIAEIEDAFDRPRA